MSEGLHVCAYCVVNAYTHSLLSSIHTHALARVAGVRHEFREQIESLPVDLRVANGPAVLFPLTPRGNLFLRQVCFGATYHGDERGHADGVARSVLSGVSPDDVLLVAHAPFEVVNQSREFGRDRVDSVAAAPHRAHDVASSQASLGRPRFKVKDAPLDFRFGGLAGGKVAGVCHYVAQPLQRCVVARVIDGTRLHVPLRELAAAQLGSQVLLGLVHSVNRPDDGYQLEPIRVAHGGAAHAVNRYVKRVPRTGTCNQQLLHGVVGSAAPPRALGTVRL